LFVLSRLRRPPPFTRFPYTRSSDLARCRYNVQAARVARRGDRTRPRREHHKGEGREYRDDKSAVRICKADEGVYRGDGTAARPRSEEHTSELQSRENLVCRLPLEKK